MTDPVITPTPAPAAGDPPSPAVVTPPPAGSDAPAGGVVTPPVEPPKTELGKEPPKAADAPAAFDPAKLTLPEGMKADDPAFKSFTELLSDDKVTPQERGQKLLTLYQDAVKSMRDQQVQLWNTTNENWVKEVKADPEIGGAKFEGVKTSISKAIDQLGPELSVAFRQGLDATGAGNHPAIWKGLAKMAALLTEGGHVNGNPPNGGQPDLASTFFPNSKM